MNTSFLLFTLTTTLVVGPPGRLPDEVPSNAIERSADEQLATAGDIVIDSVLISLVEDVEVPAREAGVLSGMRIREGQFVSEGQLLAHVDDTEVKLEHERAQIRLENAKHVAGNDVKIRFAKKSLELSQAEFKRATESTERYRKSVSDSTLDRLQLEVDKAKLDIEQSEFDFQTAQFNWRLNETELQLAAHKVARRQVMSPVSGVVVKLHRRKGEWVEPGETVARILQIDPLRAEAYIDAALLKAKLPGRAVTVQVKLNGEMTEFFGKLTFVSPEVNPVDGKVEIWAEIANPDYLLRPGLEATMVISGGRSQQLGARGE